MKPDFPAKTGPASGARSSHPKTPVSAGSQHAGPEPSVGSGGDRYDNALAETINGLLKAEAIHRCGPWRNVEAVEVDTPDWVGWFNHLPLLEPIGNIPPAEAEANYYAALENLKMAA